MEPSFWEQRWAEGRIGFHEGKPNEFLVKYQSLLTGPVLVPLCGKSVDLSYLASTRQVIGVELSQLAVEAFFDEQQLEPTIVSEGPLVRYQAGNIVILRGDFFAVTRSHVGEAHSWYDRAALIALPPALRSRYTAHLRALLPSDATGLLINVVVGDEVGPPFSVTEAEIRGHFPKVEPLDERVAEVNRPDRASVPALTQVFQVGLTEAPSEAQVRA